MVIAATTISADRPASFLPGCDAEVFEDCGAVPVEGAIGVPLAYPPRGAPRAPPDHLRCWLFLNEISRFNRCSCFRRFERARNGSGAVLRP
jgi:hypothetical protein